MFPPTFLIVAYSDNRVIGKNNSIPWNIPEDLKRFKELTTGQIVVMGRKTFESLPKGPLPNRLNIVLSRDPVSFNEKHQADNLICLKDYEALRGYLTEDIADGRSVFVIGGEQIYKEFLSFADKIYATEIHKEIEGDVYFPSLSNRIWTIESATVNNVSGDYTFDYVTYRRF